MERKKKEITMKNILVITLLCFINMSEISAQKRETLNNHWFVNAGNTIGSPISIGFSRGYANRLQTGINGGVFRGLWDLKGWELGVENKIYIIKDKETLELRRWYWYQSIFYHESLTPFDYEYNEEAFYPWDYKSYTKQKYIGANVSLGYRLPILSNFGVSFQFGCLFRCHLHFENGNYREITEPDRGIIFLPTPRLGLFVDYKF